MSVQPTDYHQGWRWTVKRVVEWVLALGVLVALLPLLGLIALAVRLDSPGPALFIQERLGRGGRVFRMYKFRTLRWDPDAKPRLNPDGTTQVDRADARLTRMGRWLRGGLDELPQLLNVLKGEMALIGPRPDEPFHRQFYTGDEERKLGVLPGITGLPQSLGRSQIQWKQRIAMDLDYIDHYTLWLDARIAFRTLALLFRSLGNR